MTDVDIVAELAKRKQVRDERMKAIRDAQRTPLVNVLPAKPEYRQHLKHPATGMAFPDDGAAVWPHDQFTKRRIRDGSVTVEETKEEPKKPAARQAASTGTPST